MVATDEQPTGKTAAKKAPKKRAPKKLSLLESMIQEAFDGT
jgi:hypothetical protein